MFLAAFASCSLIQAKTVNPTLIMETSAGTIQIELFADKSPQTVKNFLQYVETGFYNGTLFHRVIPGFMIQGGGFTKGLKQKKTGAPIRNEATNGLSNRRGTIAMARTMDIHSATAQFFINVVDNPFLDHRGTAKDQYGYCVFGRVTRGMDIADRIVNVPTKTAGMLENVPVKDVVILKFYRSK